VEKVIGDKTNILVGNKLDLASEGNREIGAQEGESLKNERLKYSYWSEYRRIMTVSEPFISPLIEHILKSLSGYGVPDYPKDIRKTIHKISKEALG